MHVGGVLVEVQQLTDNRQSQFRREMSRGTCHLLPDVDVRFLAGGLSDRGGDAAGHRLWIANQPYRPCPYKGFVVTEQFNGDFVREASAGVECPEAFQSGLA